VCRLARTTPARLPRNPLKCPPSAAAASRGVAGRRWQGWHWFPASASVFYVSAQRRLTAR